jgi:hypothetical protein
VNVMARVIELRPSQNFCDRLRQILPHGSARFFECKKCQPHSKPVALLLRSIAHRHRSDRAGYADAACTRPEFSGASAGLAQPFS